MLFNKYIWISFVVVIILILVVFWFLFTAPCRDCFAKWQNPTDKVINSLRLSYNNTYSLYPGILFFSKDYYGENYTSINKNDVVSNLDLNSNNLFFYVSSVLIDFNYDVNLIEYNGTENYQASYIVICGKDKVKLITIISNINNSVNFLDGVDGEFNCHLVISPQE